MGVIFMIKAELCSDELGPATELGNNNPVMKNILWPNLSLIIYITQQVWALSYKINCSCVELELENINNFRGNLLSFYRRGGGVRNTFFRQITPHNRCYILPKLLHYKKVAGFVQNTTKNCARRYYLGFDHIAISLVCYMNGWGWVVRNVRNNMSLSTLK